MKNFTSALSCSPAPASSGEEASYLGQGNEMAELSFKINSVLCGSLDNGPVASSPSSSEFPRQKEERGEDGSWWLVILV